MKPLLFSVLIIVFTTTIFSAPLDVHKGFKHKDSHAILVDLLKVESQLKLDLNQQNKKISIHSVLKFKLKEKGYPLINLPYDANISALKVNKKNISDVEQFKVTLMSPKITWGLRALPEALDAGEHEIELIYSLDEEIKNIISYPAQGKVDLMSFMDDYLKQGKEKNQGFIELLFPTNLQFDPYQFRLQIKVSGLKSTHLLKTNGELKGNNKSSNGELSADILFPSFFTSNSFFLHIFPEKLIEDHRSLRVSHYTSVSGKKIPVETYCPSLPKHCEYTHKTALESLALAEEVFGAYPFERLTLRKIPRGVRADMHGMEYSGAGVVSDSNVLHEVVHSWYGRSVSPYAGVDGWIDEAVAAWADNYGGGNFATAESADFNGNCRGFKNLLGKKDQTRLNSASYGQGREFLAKLDKLFASQGGIKPTLKAFFSKYKGTPVKTKQFLSFLESHPMWGEEAELIKRVLIFGTNEHFDEDKCWPAKLPKPDED